MNREFPLRFSCPAWLVSLTLLPAVIAGTQPNSTQLAPLSVPPTPDAPLFALLEPGATGISHVTHLDVDHPMSYLYHSGMTCGGVAVADFDGDGKPDIFFAGTNNTNRLYRQTDNLRFKDVTATAGSWLRRE